MTPLEAYDTMMTRLGYRPDIIDTPYIWSKRIDVEEATIQEGYRIGLTLALQLYHWTRYLPVPSIDNNIDLESQIQRFLSERLS